MTEFYVGLATLQAGLLAVFVAAVLVMAQLGSQSFSLGTPIFILKRKSILGAFLVGVLVVVCALAAAVRTAYPSIDALPGDWQTDLITDNVWLAVGMSIGAVASLLLSGLLLAQLAAALQGPGLAKALASELKVEDWVAWLEFVGPPEGEAKVELRKRYDEGHLTDPLAPLFEMAVSAIQGRRYAIIDPVLGEVRRAVEAWFLLPDGERPDTFRSAARLISHFNDLLDAALSTQAVTPIEAAVRSMEQMALNAVGRGDSPAAIRIMDELAHWAGRLSRADQPGPAAAAIHAIRGIAANADGAGNMDVFENCALALGRAGEEIAAAHKRQPERLLHADYGDVRHDAPLPALTNALDAITAHFTTHGQSIKGGLHNARFVLDCLLVAGIALLKAPEFDSHTEKAAAGVIACLGHLGLVAAKTKSNEVFGMVVYDFERLVGARQGSSADVLNSLAYYAFELGLNAENQPDANKPYSDADRLAVLCGSAEQGAVESAVSSLYLRGDTMYVPDDIQRKFVRRLEQTMGRRLENRFGISPSDGSG